MTTNPPEEGGDAAAPVLLTVAGKSFACRDTLPQWQMMKLASAYKSPDPMVVMGGMFEFMQALVLPEEFPRLDAHLSTLDIEDVNLDEAIGDAMVAMAGRGKEPRSSSPGGSSTTEPTLLGGSSSPATDPQQLPVRRVSLSAAATSSTR